MRVALSADMEGVSQLDDWRAVLAFDPAYWREGRAQMEAEVAAAARGLLTGGAEEVVVFDNHWSGNPINVRPESLPVGARLESWHMFDLRERGIDALLQVGYHSRAHLDAFFPHTYAPELVLHVDGEPISESHGRAWGADVRCSGSAVTTSTLARWARSTASPTSSRNTRRRRWMPAPPRRWTRLRSLPRTSRERAAFRSAHPSVHGSRRL
jgi:hypothetical protein